MHPPYEPEEIATALMEASQRAGRQVRRLSVIPDEQANVWIISMEDSSGDVHRLTFPFASGRGIYTPGELAERIVRGDWPFGGRGNGRT